MKSLMSLVGLAVVMGAFGCGTTVNVIGGDDDDDGSGGQGEGGAIPGDGGAGPGQGPTSTSTGPQPPPPNPAECPASSPEMYGTCGISNLACSYLEEQGCTVEYVCTTVEDCYGGETGTGGYDGGYGGYGDCYPYSYWQPSAASCIPAAVGCSAAQDGDTCALPGEYCGGGGDECTYTEKWCNDDHRWETYEYYDECCGYDDCCYDDCYCDPHYCPGTLPQEGDYCDPCYEAESCDYEIDDPDCGYLYAWASCNPYTYTWEVHTEGCTGTSSAQSGVGGGWEGTGGAF